MLLLLAAFLAVGVPAENPKLTELRAALTKQLDEADRKMAEFEQMLATDSLVETDTPQLGIVVDSEDLNQNDNLHPLRVVGTYTAGPAAAAGIQPSDRILAIGQRRIEHETTQIAYMLLAGAPNPVQLTIQRGRGTPITLSVERRKLACIDRGARAIDKALVLHQLEDIRGVSQNMRKVVKQYVGDPATLAKVEPVGRLIKEKLKELDTDTSLLINESVMFFCGVRSVSQ